MQFWDADSLRQKLEAAIPRKSEKLWRVGCGILSGKMENRLSIFAADLAMARRENRGKMIRLFSSGRH